METSSTSRATINLSTICLVVLTFFASLFVAKVLGAILVPFFIALFLALLFQPAMVKASRWGIPKIVSIVVYLGLTMLTLVVIGRLLFRSLQLFALQIQNLVPRFISIVQQVGSNLGFSIDFQTNFSMGTIMNQYSEGISQALLKFTNSSLSFASQSFMVLLLTIFLLLELRHFSYKFSTAFSSNFSERLREVGPRIALQISRYLGVKTFISAVTGLVIFITLQALGVYFAVLWGILGFLLNFIPYVGSAVVLIGTIGMGIIQFYPDPVMTTVTIVLMIAIQMLFGQILDPRLMGKNLDISPFLILLMLALFSWMWGIPGMFICIPVTVSIKIILAHFGPFKSIAILMSEGKPPQTFEGDEAYIKENWRRVYKLFTVKEKKDAEK